MTDLNIQLYFYEINILYYTQLFSVLEAVRLSDYLQTGLLTDIPSVNQGKYVNILTLM